REPERRPFDPRRGRRRHRRGRPDFGEGRHGDRRFPPPYRPEETNTESHRFEILPGESLAKYSHAIPAPLEEEEARLTEGLQKGVGQGTPTSAETLHLHDNMSGEDDDSIEDTGPIVEAVEMSVEVSPAVETIGEAAEDKSAIAPEPVAEVAQVEPTVTIGASPMPLATVTAVVADGAAPFAPGALQATPTSVGPESASAKVAEAPQPAGAAPVPPLREEPPPVEPVASAPASPAAGPETVPEIPAPSFFKPEPEAEIPASTFATPIASSNSSEGIAAPTFEEAAPQEMPEAAAPLEFAEPDSVSDDAELSVGEEEEVEGEEESLEEGELLA